MKDQAIQTHVFNNGLTLIIEKMQDVQSAAFSLLVPAGSVYDAPDKAGTACVLTDLITRGAGTRDSQQLSDALDNLGLQRHESVERKHVSFSGATLAENLPPALAIYGEILRNPTLPEDHFDAVISGAEQAIRAIDDDPRMKVMLELRRRCYPTPWSLPTEGSLEGLANLQLIDVHSHYERCFRPDETILAIAGHVDPEQLTQQIGELFGDWTAKPAPPLENGPRGVRLDHILHDSMQTQIGIAYDSVPYSSPEYYAAWAGVDILSGGSSARLFTEVREKRGLCYSVYATLHSLRDQGQVLVYAGTTAERAQQTLEVTLQELQRLPQGIREDELNRCKARAKSSLIMQQESSSSRAASMANDWYHLGRVTSPAEVRKQIEALTVETVLAHLTAHPAQDFTILTLGREPLEVSLGVS